MHTKDGASASRILTRSFLLRTTKVAGAATLGSDSAHGFRGSTTASLRLCPELLPLAASTEGEYSRIRHTAVQGCCCASSSCNSASPKSKKNRGVRGLFAIEKDSWDLGEVTSQVLTPALLLPARSGAASIAAAGTVLCAQLTHGSHRDTRHREHPALLPRRPESDATCRIQEPFTLTIPTKGHRGPHATTECR